MKKYVFYCLTALLLEIELKEDAFQHFDETTKKWTTEKGVFTILVGSSSRDIRQTTSVTW